MSAAVGETTTAKPGERPALRPALEALAARASRTLSSRAQARLELSLVGLARATVSGLSTRLGPLDRAVALVAGEDERVAFVLLSREVAFALLALGFGAPPQALGAPLPARPYTRIEERAIERTAIELWQGLGAGAAQWTHGAVRAAGLEDADRLRERADDPLWLATFSVAGLGEPVLLWLGIASPPRRAGREDRMFVSGGDDAIEAKHGMDAEGASAAGQPPDSEATPVALQGLSRPPDSAERAVWIARGSTVELDGDRAGRPVLRLDGRIVAEGTLVAGAPHPVLRIESVLDAPPEEDRDAR